MKSCKKRLSLMSGVSLATLVGAGMLTLALPGQAAATTAANAVIRNTASVSYNDAGGNPQTAVTAATDVTVNLVTAHPTLSAPGDNTTPSGVATDYVYTIVNNSNGPDQYALTAADNLPQAGITSQSHVFRNAGDTADITAIDLGATSVAAAALTGATAITVPNDGSGAGGNTPVNGIAAGDTIVIGGIAYVVASTVDNATGTSTINLTGTLGADVAVGDQVGERGTFISRTTPVATVNNSTYVITVTADDGATAGADPSDATTTTVLVTAALNVVKYVQNISSVVVCPGAPALTVNLDTGLGAGAIDYCSAGVTGNPGQTLEYVIAVSNPAGGAAATNVVISDPVPAFTTKVADNIALSPAGGAFATNTDASGDDSAEMAGSTVKIYAGTGGSDTTDVGGSLAAGATTYGAFRVNIDN